MSSPDTGHRRRANPIRTKPGGRGTSPAAVGVPEEVLRRCEKAFNTSSARHLVYYKHGLRVLALVSDRRPLSRSQERGVERLGNRLDFVHSQTDHVLSAVHGGHLQHMLLRYEDMLLSYMRVRRGEYVVFVLREGAENRAGEDRELAELVRSLRSYSCSGVSGGSVRAGAPTVHGDSRSRAFQYSRGDTAGLEEEYGEAVSAVSEDGLQYLEYADAQRVRFSVDALGHPDLAKACGSIPPAARRELYTHLTFLLRSISARLNSALPGFLEDPLLEMTIETSDTTVCYRAIDGESFLLGAVLGKGGFGKVNERLRALALLLPEGRTRPVAVERG